jgi:hypothetical protein
VNAQPIKRYKTFSYSVNEGLLQSTVWDLAIDKNNFCWISFPNGIQKFDGQNFSIIPIQPGLSDDKNTHFFKCKNGDLLIGHSKGISKYDIDRNSFELIYKCPVTINYPPLFIGEDNGIIYFTLLTGTIIELESHTFKKIAETELTFGEDLFKSTNYFKISDSIIDHKVAFIYNTNLYLWDLQKRKLSKKSKLIPLMSGFFLMLKSGNEVQFYKRGSNYLYSYNFSTDFVSRKPSPGYKSNYISRTNFFTWHGENLVSFDKNVFETDSDFNKLNTRLVNFQNQPIGNSAISIIKEDNFGNLWVTTVSDGIKKIINNNYNIKYYGVPQSNINNALTIFPDKKVNRVFIGSAKGGLFVYDTMQQLIKSIINIPGNNLPLAINQVIENDKNEYFLFIAGARFIAKVSPGLNHIRKIPFTTSLPAERSGASYFANLLYQNKFEAVVQSQGSIYRLNFSDNSVREYAFTTSYTHSGFLYHGRIITHFNDELVYLDTSNFQVIKRIPFINTGGVRCFAKAGDNQIYLGTNKGIFKIDSLGRILAQHNRSTGLPDDCIYTITPDKDHNLWCSTNKGIIKISPDKSFLQITREDGLQENEFNTNAMAIADDGEYFYGGVNGGNSFFPSSINPEEQELNLLITTLLVNNEEKFADTAVWNISNLSLPYNQNLLSFDFIAMGNNNPGQYIYQYKMKGIDDRWILNNDMQTIRYFLPPGEYVLQVYASRYFNSNAHPLKQITITIHPPFWKTWWFLSLIGFLCLAILTYIIDSYIRHVYQKKVALFEAEKNIQAERERISRDLHDNIGGYANAVLYKTELLKDEDDDYSRQNIISDLRFASKEIITSLRETIWALKRTDYSAQDCLIRIKNFVQPFNKYYPFIHFKIDGDAPEEKTLPHTNALHIVRIVQEAVSNAIKHANAENIDIISRTVNNQWILSVKDDGKGFDVNTYTDIEVGNGLANMRKRVAETGVQLQINSGF